MSNTAPPSPTAPLQIAVIGLGGIGSAFAFQLAQTGGHHVTAIARPNSPRLAQLQRDQAILNTKGESAPISVAATLDETTPFDLILVTLLAHQVDAVLPALQRSAAKHIQFMFNIFDPERLRDALGPNFDPDRDPDRCIFGMPFIQASLTPDGKLNAKIGAGGQKSKMSTPQSVDLFNAAGLPAVLEPNMLLWLRCHAPLGAAFESVCVAARRRNGGATWTQAAVIARGLQESLTLVQRLGYQLYPAGKARLHSLPTWIVAAMLFSVSRIPSFRDLLATGENECRALIDVLVANAPRAVPPVNVATILAMKP